MVALDFFDFFNRFQPNSYGGLEDFADKMSFMYTVIILLISTTIVTLKSYVIESIACYINTVPSGENFQSYVENYCWVHGTIPFQSSAILPQTREEWSNLKLETTMTYYQWVPFVLGLQTILFYIPRILWQMFCFNIGLGTDLEQVIQQSQEINKKPFNERNDEYRNISDVIINVLYLHRDFRHGKLAEIKRKVFNKISFIVPSKRLGSKLIFWYLIMKLVYLGNAFFQLWIIQRFLHSHNSLPSFSWFLLSYISSGNDNKLNNYFPRVVFCNIPHIRHVGGRNDFTAQCVLPVNMLNEKIYIFLWFWIVLVFILTLISIPIWFVKIFRFQSKWKLIKKYLRMQDVYADKQKDSLMKFVSNFLKYDGVFILRMIGNNAGDVVASHITKYIWSNYLEKNQELEPTDICIVSHKNLSYCSDTVI